MLVALYPFSSEMAVVTNGGMPVLKSATTPIMAGCCHPLETGASVGRGL